MYLCSVLGQESCKGILYNSRCCKYLVASNFLMSLFFIQLTMSQISPCVLFMQNFMILIIVSATWFDRFRNKDSIGAPEVNRIQGEIRGKLDWVSVIYCYRYLPLLLLDTFLQCFKIVHAPYLVSNVVNIDLGSFKINSKCCLGRNYFVHCYFYSV